MAEDDLDMMSRDRSTWTEAERKEYESQSWIARKFLDVLLVFPGLTKWLIRKFMKAEDRKEKRFDRRLARERARDERSDARQKELKRREQYADFEKAFEEKEKRRR
jgi:hypothetical protein